jgi:hypothetical protein
LALQQLDEAEVLFQRVRAQMPNSPGVYAGLEAVAKERGDSEAQVRWAEERRAREGNKQ